MAEERVERRLTAILAADIAGYSALMGADEARTVHDLKGHQAVVLPMIAEFGGRIIDTAGDGILAEFASVVSAVKCAVAIQKTMSERNSAIELKRRMQFRIGINVGDIIVDEHRIYGDGVNIAARLESMADPGGICVSARVQEDVIGRLEVAFEDMGECELKNISRPLRLYRLLSDNQKQPLAGGRGRAPVEGKKRRPNNLPADLSSFIGRTKEISDIKKLLASARLLTLTGVGGAGKTRLAIKVAEEMLEHFADGAWLVELAGLSDSALVPQTVASTLGISEQQGRPLIETLIQDLGPKSMLLVIDNCEHLLTACAELVSKALRASSRVRIVATSREKLGVSGEVSYRVPSLSIPEIDSVISPDVLMNYEAPRLFIERAACVQVGFAATPSRVNQIVQICARLDGLPLAIELAAVRVNVLSVDQICSRLNDRFRLLGQGSRAPLERHQTLKAVIDWSYQLLSDAERTLLRRLSVFAGNWTLEAAEAICVGDGLQEGEVLDLMARLIDKSLVVAQTQGSEARYLLLETVRQYGQTKLIEGGEDKVKRDVHLLFFSALAERAEPHLQGLEMVKWAERVEADNDNIRAALRWSLNGGDPAVGLRLAGAMAFFWRTRGYVNEGSLWFEGLLLRTPDGPYFARAKAYFGTGWLAWWKGANLEATELTEKALYTFRSLGDKWWIARSLQEIAFHSFARGEYERSASLAEEALALAHDLGDKYVAGYSLVLKAIVAEHLGDDVKATAMYRECLAARRQVGPIFGISTALRGLGRVALRHGHYDEARRAYTEGLSLALKERDRSSAAPSLEGIVALAIRQHAYERAAKLLGAAEEQRQAIGIPPLAWELHSYESSLKALAALFGEESLTLLRAEGRNMTLDQAIAYGQEDF